MNTKQDILSHPNIIVMRVCCWKSQFESMAQDFGDQAFRDCWLFARIFPPPAASFHLPIIWLAISDVTRITQACQCLYPLCSVAPSLVLPVGHWQADLIRSSLAILHQASLCIFQPLHQQSIWSPPIKTTFFLEIESSASLSIHLPLGGNFQVVSQEFHPNFFSLCFPPSFEIRLQTRNPNFSRMSD